MNLKMKKPRAAVRKTLIFFVIAVLSFGLADSVYPRVYADKLSDLQAEQNRLKNEKAAIEKSIKDTAGVVEKLDEYLAYYDDMMRVQEEELDNIKEQIKLIELDIDDLRGAIVAKQKEVDDGIAAFRLRLREMYILGDDNLAAVLAGSADFYDMLMRMELFERIARQDKLMLDRLNEMIDGLESDKAALESALAAEEEKREEAERAYADLKATYDNHRETKTMREKELADFEARGDEIEAREERLEKEIQAEIRRQQEEAERRRKEQEERLRREEEERRKAAEAKGEVYVPRDTTLFTSYSVTGFIWPAPTVRNMGDGYGTRWIIEEKRSQFHKGIDITKPGCGGEPAVASAAGEVITAGNTGNGYGKHVVIDHGNKVSTLYGHFSEVYVKVGDIVAQGQKIGAIGSTGNSYGNHLHFEVRINGQHVDPLDYVNINN
jgi:murein DD-endopeptidase MepM/ murein hydrolase activator NlpD